MIPLSRLHTHASTLTQTKTQPQSKLTPDAGVYSGRTLHGFSIGLSKPQLIETICKELGSELGHQVNIRDVTNKNVDAWRDFAVPLPGQTTPIKGLRVLDGIICNLCTDPLTAFSSPTRHSIDKHRPLAHPNSQGTRKKTYHGLIQTMSHASGLVRYFPAPGNMDRTCGTGPLIEEEGEEDDSDGGDDVAMMLRKAKEDMLGNSPASAADIMDRRTVVPFFLDSGVHDFLQQYDARYLLSLWRVPSRRSKDAPLELRRLYAIVLETFFSDCDMATKMNPSIRRAIVQCDPYVNRSCPSFSVKI